MTTLGDLAESNQIIIKQAIDKARLAKSDNHKVSIILSAIDKLHSKLSDVAITSMPDKVSVKNLDEVQLSLRKELSKATRPLLDEMRRLNITTEQLERVRKEAEFKVSQGFDDNFDTFIIKKAKKSVTIDNFDDLRLPDQMRVNNLDDLQIYFNSLSETIRETFDIDIPTPQVTVQAPDVEVNVPEISIPPMDIGPLIEIMNSLKKVMKPFDGKSFLNEFKQSMRQIEQNANRNVTAFSNSQGATKKDISRILGTPQISGSGVKSLSSATVAVQMSTSNIKIRWVDVSAVQQPIAIGASNVVVDLSTAANSRGSIIYPGSNPLRVETTNVNQVYVAGPTGSAASYTYYA